MQIVIEISETLKKIADEGDIKTFSHFMWLAIVMDAIKNGTPLPKGHGDLIDRDEVEKLEETLCATECGCCMLDGCFYDRAEAIIKADKSEEE